MKELIIPLSVIGVVASMLVPMPPGALDYLLIINLLLGFSLLISALYVTEPLRLSSLPTMLLLATLYRLGLNVSTTRLILSTGEAGRAIEAFGSVVIQGNLLVGLVIFCVITLIQFIVIAKGAERVAEVAARFTLDALPGKQMSIDADVRAGLIDFASARKKRQDLQIESRFYGALDGAMKFVKGDAIAGLIITAVNICGGLFTGLALEGLEPGAAISKYTLLTVGDGLLSQIPALLNALAAGMVVTRVSHEDGSSLASEVLGQLGQLPKVRLFIGLLSLGLSFAPAMPALPFIFIGAATIGSLAFSPQKTTNVATLTPFEPRVPALVMLDLPEGMRDRSIEKVRKKAHEFRQKLYDAHGLVVPLPEITFSGIKEHGRLCLRGVTVAKLMFDSDEATPLDTVLAQALTALRSALHEIVDDALTRRTLDAYERECPELVAAVVPGVVSLTQLTEVLKQLVKEGVSIRNFDSILQAVAESGAKAPNDRALVGEVRVALRRLISATYADLNDEIRAMVLDPLVDYGFAKAEREQRLPEFGEIEALAQRVRARISRGSKNREPLICSKAARRLVYDCLAVRGIEVTVLAHEEISNNVSLIVTSLISLEPEQEKRNTVEALAA